jgi:hypothetical protein
MIERHNDYGRANSYSLRENRNCGCKHLSGTNHAVGREQVFGDPDRRETELFGQNALLKFLSEGYDPPLLVRKLAE